MKYVFVALVASLSIMVLTKGRPVVEPEPYHLHKADVCSSGFCIIRHSDGFCRRVNTTCEYEKLNCLLQDTPWRLWHYASHESECRYVKQPNQVAICKSSCPVFRCHSTEPACGANSLNGHCSVYENLCKLKKKACRNKEIFHADMQRCAKAGLRKPGDSGRC